MMNSAISKRFAIFSLRSGSFIWKSRVDMLRDAFRGETVATGITFPLCWSSSAQAGLSYPIPGKYGRGRFRHGQTVNSWVMPWTKSGHLDGAVGLPRGRLFHPVHIQE